jgi:hypothetical protein
MSSYQHNRDKIPCVVKAPDKQRPQLSAAHREPRDHKNWALNHRTQHSATQGELHDHKSWALDHRTQQSAAQREWHDHKSWALDHRMQLAAAQGELHGHMHQALNQRTDDAEEIAPERLKAKQQLLAGSREPYLCLPGVSVYRGVHILCIVLR